MFNILPDSIKQKIVKEYRLRKSIVVLFFVLIVGLIFLVFMLPSWVVSYSKERELMLQVDKLHNSSVSEDININKSLVRSLNNELSIIDKNQYYPKVLPVFNKIIDLKNQYIHINQFSYSNNNSTTTISISISGVSDDRDSLFNFKKNLDDSKYFKSVDLPISNYAKEKNIGFTINLIFVQKNEK